jgi:hypothetical protein
VIGEVGQQMSAEGWTVVGGLGNGGRIGYWRRRERRCWVGRAMTVLISPLVNNKTVVY